MAKASNKISRKPLTSDADRELKVELVRRGISVKQLAEQIKRPVPTVSTAVNHADRFPRVRAQIREVLYA
jgi:DNA-binding NarL/FixJ family response regulator